MQERIKHPKGFAVDIQYNTHTTDDYYVGITFSIQYNTFTIQYN